MHVEIFAGWHHVDASPGGCKHASIPTQFYSLFTFHGLVVSATTPISDYPHSTQWYVSIRKGRCARFQGEETHLKRERERDVQSRHNPYKSRHVKSPIARLLPIKTVHRNPRYE